MVPAMSIGQCNSFGIGVVTGYRWLRANYRWLQANYTGNGSASAIGIDRTRVEAPVTGGYGPITHVTGPQMQLRNWLRAVTGQLHMCRVRKCNYA